ncbi:hypothetical protein JR316_0005654 [Psilocybe cubensis]|uniref:Uncharacterized protein n=2 Tax=Psilocybe cubensis TaxID=181762 RepID=A0A8H7Y296_PSICU|nr:hypothetical protein JR316_0005654 [Psilocybe cubensis]KAH9481134.1 hypothetical protein JR316_0005654 [Psilocybe cubensis]
MPLTSQIDWSKGTVFIHDGTLICSPNSKRFVILPCGPPSLKHLEAAKDENKAHLPYPGSTHFDRKLDIDLALYRQPVQWEDSYGWLAFVPLSPSFISLPFKPLSWTPEPRRWRTGQTTYQWEVESHEKGEWYRCESQLVYLCEKLRLWYRIPGTPPPVPSRFGYDRPHRSKEIAEKMVEVSRNAFVLWMGFLSYLIAQSRRPEHAAHLRDDGKKPVPAWHTKILEEQAAEAAAAVAASAQTGWDPITPPPPLITEPWLDGLRQSVVWNFTPQTPRAGIAYDWTTSHRTRPPIEFFLDNAIAVYYPWGVVEEDTMKTHKLVRQDLRPPSEMLATVLDEFLGSTDVPLATLFMRKYYEQPDSTVSPSIKLLGQSHSQSFVFQHIMDRYHNEQTAFERAWDNPDNLDIDDILRQRSSQVNAKARRMEENWNDSFTEGHEMQGRISGVVDVTGDVRGIQNTESFTDWEPYWTRRLAQWRKALENEDPAARRLRLAREKQKPTRRTKMYQWKMVRHANGTVTYLRQLVSPNMAAKLYHKYRPRQVVYNSIDNVWDLCRYFKPPIELAQGGSDNSDLSSGSSDESDPGPIPLVSKPNQVVNTPEPQEPRVQQFDPSSRPPTPAAEHFSGYPGSPDMQVDAVHSHVTDTVPPPDVEPALTLLDARPPPAPKPDARTGWMVPARNLVQSLRLGYGYTGPGSGFSVRASTTTKDERKEWLEIVESLGFLSANADDHLEEADKQTVQVFYQHYVVSDSEDMLADLCDLHPNNKYGLHTFLGLREVQRPHKSMFVFSEPRSQWSDWKLGVETAEVALYVCRLMQMYPTLDIDDIGYKLLSKGVPCRTFVKIPASPRSKTVVDKFIPTSFRPAGYTFVVEDFLEYRHQCETLLSMPQGRAAVLKGGIISRIASEYLGLLSTLEGPSPEIITNKQGFMILLGPNECWADDELTEKELAVLCGTYGMYTGKLTSQLAGSQLTHLYTARANQTTIVSWFPPADLWAPGSLRNGRQLIEWTPDNEKWYQDRVRDILAGQAQPHTKVQWRTWYRGIPQARRLKEQSSHRSADFVDRHLPITQGKL